MRPALATAIVTRTGSEAHPTGAWADVNFVTLYTGIFPGQGRQISPAKPTLNGLKKPYFDREG
jgi:hypothetical protein